MTPKRWLVVLLIVSWTLNVALGVAIFMAVSHHHPHPGMPPGAWPGRMHWPDPPGRQLRDDLHRELSPLGSEQRRLSSLLVDLLSDEQLDTARVRAVSESLATLRSSMQERFHGRLVEWRETIPPEDRRLIFRKLLLHDEARIRHPGAKFKSKDEPQ
ncbi:MAG: periplasmic heavy metal sensor [Calditrichaeota bacterium]|nr:periplasmic heavy metal sensor [Calditrichota bacterium]